MYARSIERAVNKVAEEYPVKLRRQQIRQTVDAMLNNEVKKLPSELRTLAEEAKKEIEGKRATGRDMYAMAV